jgi:hypothetical protein
MSRLLNGFNNGRDTTDGIGGKKPINNTPLKYEVILTNTSSAKNILIDDPTIISRCKTCIRRILYYLEPLYKISLVYYRRKRTLKHTSNERN